jgi:hypothetical protein
VRSAPNASAAWSALLPDDTIWLSGRGHAGARGIRRAMDAIPPGERRTIAVGPLSMRRNAGPRPMGGSHVLQSYVAVPFERPTVVASTDGAVLRYVADSVLSVPSGVGRIPSMLFTAGLRLLRRPTMWTLGAVVRAGGVVLVGRSP